MNPVTDPPFLGILPLLEGFLIASSSWSLLMYFKPLVGNKNVLNKKICGPIEKLFVLYENA